MDSIIDQGHQLKGIDNKTLRRLRRLQPLFTYVLFLVTHFLKDNKNVRNSSFYYFQTLFLNGNHICKLNYFSS
jgi:hypothetical protein